MDSCFGVPPEIWSKIFTLCSPDDYVHCLNVRIAPWTTSQVCQQWREICHNTPHLWTNIYLPPTRRGKGKGKRYLSSVKYRLATRLRLAQQMPLDVRIPIGLVNTQVEDACVKALWPRREFWKEIHLNLVADMAGEPEDIWVKLSSEVRENRPSFSMLTHLSIIVQLPASYDRLDWPRRTIAALCEIFHFAPSLRSVAIKRGGVLLPSTILERLQWNQLEVLAIPTGLPGYLPVVLASLTNVVELALSSHTDLPHLLHVIDLPRLKSLTVYDQSYDLLSRLKAPSLQSLSFMSTQRDDISSIPSFIHRSNCHLRELTLPLQLGMKVHDLLDSLPQLRSLHVFHSKLNTLNRLILGLAGDSSRDSPPPCPHLTTLSLREERYLDDLLDDQPSLCPNQIADMLEARWHVSSSLIDAGSHSRLMRARMGLSPRRLHVWNESLTPALERMRVFLQEGLDVEIIMPTEGPSDPGFLVSLVKGTQVENTIESIVRYNLY